MSSLMFNYFCFYQYLLHFLIAQRKVSGIYLMVFEWVKNAHYQITIA